MQEAGPIALSEGIVGGVVARMVILDILLARKALEPIDVVVDGSTIAERDEQPLKHSVSILLMPSDISTSFRLVSLVNILYGKVAGGYGIVMHSNREQPTNSC